MAVVSSERTGQGIRVLGPSDLADFLRLTDRNQVVNVFAEYRARLTTLDPRWLGGEVWGRYVDGALVAACHVGANLVPVECTEEDARRFGHHALTTRRTATSIFGEEPAVAAFWEVASQEWGRPRECRWHQPHLVIAGPPAVPPDPRVRKATHADFDLLLPACVDMYTEEVGVPPDLHGGFDLYRARVRQLVSRGWSFVWIEDDRVVFKAEAACVTAHAAQIQGVWVAHDRRGEGLASVGMAAVVELVRRHLAPVVSLYANEWNAPALAAYRRAGFQETTRFATIMF